MGLVTKSLGYAFAEAPRNTDCAIPVKTACGGKQ
jgi:hypothetical protein